MTSASAPHAGVVNVSVTHVALAIVVAFVAATNRAEAGPVKNWAAFPDREVRAIALRGDWFGREPNFTVAQGRDGYVYLRGRYGLYQVVDDDGRNAPVADTAACSGYFESHGVDDRTPVPRALCSRANMIIVAAATWHDHIRTPTPNWPGQPGKPPDDVLRERYLTAVVPAAGGGYWFAYSSHGVGRVYPSGRSTLRRVPALGSIVGMAASGDDVYVVDTDCRVAHLRGLALVGVQGDRCGEYYAWQQRLVSTPDGAVWILSPASGVAERHGSDGSTRRWKLGMNPIDVAVTHDGTAYMLGNAGTDGQAVIAIIRSGKKPDVRAVPVNRPGSITVDARDRLWITVPMWHAAAIIAPAQLGTRTLPAP